MKPRRNKSERRHIKRETGKTEYYLKIFVYICIGTYSYGGFFIMIRTAVFGYGNLGRGTLRSILSAEDMKAVGVFTRREKAEVYAEGGIEVYPANSILSFEADIDVLFICGGSADDLPEYTPKLAEKFNVIDSFDRHPEIKRHFDSVNCAALKGKHLALISAGWDPGIFSAARAMSKAVFPQSEVFTFWGEGVSQGHSEAVRRIKGVKDAIQVTVPKEDAVRAAQNGTLSDGDGKKTHTRRCYVASEEGADRARIENEIRTMPDYFDGYETEIEFVSETELNALFPTMFHGGRVIANAHGAAAAGAELSLTMRSNPDFTGAVLTAYGRAVYRAAKKGRTGAVTVLDIPISDMLPPSADKSALI